MKSIDIEEKLLHARKEIFDKTSYKLIEFEQPEAPSNFTSEWLKPEEEHQEPALNEDAGGADESGETEPETKEEKVSREKKVNGSFFDDIE